MSELFNSHERNQIARFMTRMDVAYNQHDIDVLQTHKDGLFDYISDLVVRKVTEQQMEEVENLKEKGVSDSKIVKLPYIEKSYSNKLQIKFKKLHPDAVTPARATDGSAGWDLTALTIEKLDIPGNVWKVHTGIAVEIPKGYVGKLYARSSCFKYGIMLSNSVGIIDADYRGEVCFIFSKVSQGYDGFKSLNPGERVGQILIELCPDVELVEVDELSETERGQGGFGSTGK
jgi:dUTP pyrophosphatase